MCDSALATGGPPSPHASAGERERERERPAQTPETSITAASPQPLLHQPGAAAQAQLAPTLLHPPYEYRLVDVYRNTHTHMIPPVLSAS